MTFNIRVAVFAVLAFVSVAVTPVARVAAQAAPVAQAAATATTTTCSREWVGREAEIEEFLLTAKVAKLEDVPIGVTKPRRAVFEPGGLVRRAAWKVLAPSYRSGFRESYKAEIAAYELDKLLEMRMVPPNVERKVDGLTGAIVYWIENTTGWDIKKPVSGPEPGWSAQLTRMKMFDQLIGNIDRNQGNLIYDADWHLFLIDHSRAFIEKKDLKGIAALARVDRALWDRMKALTFDQLQASSLGKWLSKKEIEALLIRRDRMQQEIDKMVAARGESFVFF